MRTPFILIITAFVLMSCSTMTFIPEEGTAGKFNLATTEYVKAQQSAQLEAMMTEIQTYVDTLLMQEREELMGLIGDLGSIDSTLYGIEMRLDSLETGTAATLSAVGKELSAVKTNASSTRMVIRRLNDNVDEIPNKTLETFTKAIQSYLDSQKEETAGE